ncbi:Agenet domain-containing protein [Striga hermonthica]|uniref:Agenet domain-containing protein n=1 Tax=Striga hermonthica TaxID=68872 RepID=A0A9N7MSA7_STRHE|nr:Agenet domain-containing protein [Striga hermonthica]
MDNEIYLTWEVGQLAEARSFQHGYRGAWFRCKSISTLLLSAEPRWLKLYQVTPNRKYNELMLRPCYPPIYNAKEIPHTSEISEVSVIFDGSWKVGDFVDWMFSDCYWSGTITQLLGGGKAEIELKPPPHGEGKVYVAEFKDLRPSLDWYPEYGWTMPKKEGDSGRPSAWLLKPKEQGEETMVVSNEMKSTETKDTYNKSSQPTAPKKTKRTKKREDYDDNKTKSGQAKTEPKLDVADKENLDSGEDEKGKGGLVLNSARFDTLEAAVMDLEEYLNKVKWLKIVLEQGISPPDDKSEWQFVEPLVDHDATK